MTPAFWSDAFCGCPLTYIYAQRRWCRMIASEKGNFFMVSNRIFELGLKPRDFIVYCCLLRHSDNNIHTCFPSRRLIAKECCMDRKTVDSAIENLSALGLVKKVCRYREDGTKTSNLYYVANLSMDSVTVSYQ